MFRFIVISKRTILYLCTYDLSSRHRALDLLLFGPVGHTASAPAQCLKIFKVKNLCLPTCTYKHLTQYRYFLIGCFNKLFPRLLSSFHSCLEPNFRRFMMRIWCKYEKCPHPEPAKQHPPPLPQKNFAFI